MRQSNVVRWALSALVVVLCATPALATAPKVATVPWSPGGAIYTKQHTTYDGYNMLLMGVATDVDNDLVSYEWTFGDGSPPVGGGLMGGEANIEVRHVYNGADNTPFTAQLVVCDTSDCTTDLFRLVVKAQTLDIDVNIAIDEGLWALHKRQVKTNVAPTGAPAAYWDYFGTRISPTASTVQAFLINEHLTPDGGGDPDQDPYVDTVARGVNYIVATLARVNTAPQVCQAEGSGTFDPDSNGNGYALGANSGSPIYETGQVMDGLAATRTPLATAEAGIPEVLGQTFEQIATDMGDYYSYCMDDAGADQGGWRYSCNNDSDNSACQWGAIGYLGVTQTFGVPVPACVKSQNEIWLNYSGTADGRFGYADPGSCISGCMATTPAGMAQLAMDDIPPTDARWVQSERWLCENWTGGLGILNSGNMYAYYALAKALRSAVGGVQNTLGDDPANPCASPVNWYDDDPGGLARYLVNNQRSDGLWTDFYWVGTGDLPTAWAIIILRPTLVCPSPVPECDADPSNTTSDCPVDFDDSQSFHPGAGNPLPGCGSSIVLYEWDFEGDGTYDFSSTDPGMVSHSYGAFGVFNATLRVTDEIGVTATTACPITVGPPPIDPDADPDGPYELCLNIPGDRVILDGSGSLDPDNSPCQAGNGIATYEWELDFVFPLDFAEGSGAIYDATAFYAGFPAGVYDVGLRVTDDEGATNEDFTTVTVIPECEIICPPDPDPHSQGYWHRQCLGLPAPLGIDPGRNGRGPQSPTEPDFEELLMPAAEGVLEGLFGYFIPTCEGMDADPPSDPCEKAVKQFTAMILNLVSGRIAEGCVIDPEASPCESGDVGSLLFEIAGLIQSGDCDTANECGAAVNEGYSVLGGGGTYAVIPQSESRVVAAPRLIDNRPRGTYRGALIGDRQDRVLYYLVPEDYVVDNPLALIVSRGPATDDGPTRVEAYGPSDAANQRIAPKETARDGRNLP